MSDNGVIAEDERSQIKDEGGDDEVRDGPFRYTHYRDPRLMPWDTLGSHRNAEERPLIKNCAGRNISNEEKGGRDGG